MYSHQVNSSRTSESSFFNLPTPTDVPEPSYTAISTLPSTAPAGFLDVDSLLSPSRPNGLHGFSPRFEHDMRTGLLEGFEVVNHPKVSPPGVESLSSDPQLFDAIEFLPTVNSDLSTSSTPISIQPSQPQLLELTRIFFQQHHPFLPCIHAQHILDRISDPQWAESSPLMWSILAVVSRSSSAVEIMAQQRTWYERALILYDRSVSSNVGYIQYNAMMIITY